MTLHINKRETVRIPVEVAALKWQEELAPTSVARNFTCSACRGKLGARRFAVAWIKAGKTKRSMRLCEDCGKAAEGEEQAPTASDYLNQAMITVRCSAQLRDALKELAHERQTTLNRLCIDLLREAVQS